MSPTHHCPCGEVETPGHSSSCQMGLCQQRRAAIEKSRVEVSSVDHPRQKLGKNAPSTVKSETANAGFALPLLSLRAPFLQCCMK